MTDRRSSSEIVNALRAIIVRCDEGDKRSDRLPIILGLAKSVLPKALALEAGDPAQAAPERGELEMLRERLGPRGLEVVEIDGAGHYVNEKVKAEIERLRGAAYAGPKPEAVTDALALIKEAKDLLALAYKATGYKSKINSAVWQLTYAERALAVPSTDREYDPGVAPCDDAEFGMKP